MVIFGITGDLARKMTFRALYRLETRGELTCRILGIARNNGIATNSTAMPARRSRRPSTTSTRGAEAVRGAAPLRPGGVRRPDSTRSWPNRSASTTPGLLPRDPALAIRRGRAPAGKPTEFCAPVRTGFANPTIEDRYSFQSVATRSSDGLITDDSVSTIGNLRACFGPTSDPMTVNFYAEGGPGGLNFTGQGECLTVKPNHPENGMTVARCFLELRDSLTPTSWAVNGATNTMRSRALIGSVTDPPWIHPDVDRNRPIVEASLAHGGRDLNR